MESKEAWEKIAPGWSSLKQSPFPPEIFNIRNWKGSILDIGCGNCRNLLIFHDSELYGVDFSESMIEEAKRFCEKRHLKVDLRVADAKKLPFKDGFFSYIICVSLLCTMKKDDSIEVLKEIRRLLKPNGKAFLSTWNIDWPGNAGKPKEVIEPWNRKGEIIERYYYLFDEKEFAELVESLSFKIEENYTEKEGKSISFVVSKAGVA